METPLTKGRRGRGEGDPLTGRGVCNGQRYGSWVKFSQRLVPALRQPTTSGLKLIAIEEIEDETGTTITVGDFRDRSYWKSCRTGAKDFDTHTKAGLALQEHLDGRGKVITVTYRLAHAHAMA